LSEIASSPPEITHHRSSRHRRLPSSPDLPQLFSSVSLSVTLSLTIPLSTSESLSLLRMEEIRRKEKGRKKKEMKRNIRKKKTEVCVNFIGQRGLFIKMTGL
jgi:hypothetical protein